MDGYSFPGLTEKEIESYFPNLSSNFVNRFQTDPPPFFVDQSFSIEEYWEAVDHFLAKYNQLVLDARMDQHNQSAYSTPGSSASLRE